MTFSPKDFRKQAKADGHSKEFIDVTVAYARVLIKNKVPVIFSTKHLALLIGMQPSYLRYIINNRDDQYHHFKIEKRRQYKGQEKKYRDIMAPSEALKAIQQWINTYILQQVKLHNKCRGFRKGLSIRDNALPHAKKKYIFKADLLKFFNTINEKRVYGVFRSLGYHPNLARDLAILCTAQQEPHYWNDLKPKEVARLGELIDDRLPVLPQGAPTSPALANIIATRMDMRLDKLAKKRKLVYTRYADDLCFSSNKVIPPRGLIEKIIEDEGLFVNDAKVNLYKRGVKQYVTGLTITHGVHVSKKYRKDIYMHLYYAQKYGPEQHLKWLEKKKKLDDRKYAFRDWLFGRIAFVYSVSREIGEDMISKFNKINWEIDPVERKSG